MKMKLLIIPCLILMAFGLTSFVYSKYSNKSVKSADKKVDPNSYWFHYTGPIPMNYWDAFDSDNYTIIDVPEEELFLCEGHGNICAILAKRNWNGFNYRPDLTDMSYAGIYEQLYDYVVYGMVGTRIIEKY